MERMVPVFGAADVRLEVLEWLPGLAAKRRLDLPLLLAVFDGLPIRWKDQGALEEHEEEARRRIAARDADDWPTVALAHRDVPRPPRRPGLSSQPRAFVRPRSAVAAQSGRVFTRSNADLFATTPSRTVRLAIVHLMAGDLGFDATHVRFAGTAGSGSPSGAAAMDRGLRAHYQDGILTVDPDASYLGVAEDLATSARISAHPTLARERRGEVVGGPALACAHREVEADMEAFWAEVDHLLSPPEPGDPA
jgi:hypothetical protein